MVSGKARGGRVVVITGGAQGIGRATAEAFVRTGHRVIVADSDPEALALLQAPPFKSRDKGTLRGVLCDVAIPAHLEALFADVAQNEGRVDVLVCNAGIGKPRPLAERSLDEWNHILAVNLTAPFLCTQLALSLMHAGSAVIMVSSTRALMSEPDTEPYSASKGGVLALVHSLAVSLGPRGIRVNAISPGWIDVTGWHKQGAVGQVTLSEADHAQHPVGRVGEPEDVAQACLFLADARTSGFVTGTNLVVDGGMTRRMIYVE